MGSPKKREYPQEREYPKKREYPKAWQTCPQCRGESSEKDLIPCPQCQGKGEIQKVLKVTCKVCRGKIKIPCKTCLGKGRDASGATCSKCLGKRHTVKQCRACESTGVFYKKADTFIACPTCNRFGTIWRKGKFCDLCYNSGRVLD